jgi:hypothetical protein
MENIHKISSKLIEDPKKIIFLVRHGERCDRIGLIP